MLQCLIIIWPHWNFQRELLPVLKPKIPEHLRLHESSTEYPFLPQCTPFLSISIFKTKQNKKPKPRPRVVFTWNQESGGVTREMRGEPCGEAPCSGCLFPSLRTVSQCLSSPWTWSPSLRLAEETLCYPGVNLQEGVLESPEDTHIFRVSILSIFKMFYILKKKKCSSLSLCNQWPSSIHSEWKNGDCQCFPWSSLRLP